MKLFLRRVIGQGLINLGIKDRGNRKTEDKMDKLCEV